MIDGSMIVKVRACMACTSVILGFALGYRVFLGYCICLESLDMHMKGDGWVCMYRLTIENIGGAVVRDDLA